MDLHPFKKLLYNQLLTLRYVLGHTKQYQSGKQKSRLHIFRDLLSWQILEGEFNTMYYAMGLHLTGLRQNEYTGRKSFLKIKNKVEKKLKNNAGCDAINYDAVTKDKFYANSILAANGIPCVRHYALVSGSYLIYPDSRFDKTESLLTIKEPFFIKNITLEAGEGVYKCRIAQNKIELNNELKEWNEFKAFLGDKTWIVQKQHYSHISLRKINESALNTIRIVTMLNCKDPEYLCGFHGFATGHATTDSWSYGSVYVGIDVDRECLAGDGLTSPSDIRSGLLKLHPDSGIRFEGYPIPYLKEAVDICIRAHRLFYFNFIIGWDIAIADQGPLIVEVNEKPGMNVAQSLSGGMKKKIFKYASQILTSKNLN